MDNGLSPSPPLRSLVPVLVKVFLLVLVYSLATFAACYRLYAANEAYLFAFFPGLLLLPLGFLDILNQLVATLKLPANTFQFPALKLVVAAGAYALYPSFLLAIILVKKRWQLITLTITLLALLTVNAAGCQRVDIDWSSLP